MKKTMTIREAVETMTPSQKRFMKEEIFGNEVEGIDFDEKVEKREYEFSVSDDNDDTYMKVVMSGDGEELNIDNTGKRAMVEYTVAFDVIEDSDEYYFEAI